MKRGERKEAARRLGAKREALGLGAGIVAAGLGVDRSTLWRWETGRVAPSAATLKTWFVILALAESEQERRRTG